MRMSFSAPLAQILKKKGEGEPTSIASTEDENNPSRRKNPGNEKTPQIQIGFAGFSMRDLVSLLLDQRALKQRTVVPIGSREQLLPSAPRQ